jgi:hypothetical protein
MNSLESAGDYEAGLWSAAEIVVNENYEEEIRVGDDSRNKQRSALEMKKASCVSRES